MGDRSSVNFQRAYPPEDVAAAFRDVSSAREDKNKVINEAEGYANSTIPKARGEADRLLAEAGSFAQVQQDTARGEAEAFDAIVSEYRTNSAIYGRDVTRFRLYLEKMEKIFPKITTYVVKPGEQVNLRILSSDEQVSVFPPFAPGQ